jgi:hypothetical protein
MPINSELVASIGKYAGPAGVILLIEAVLLLAMMKMNGSPEQRQNRFKIVAWMTLIFGLAATASGIAMNSKGRFHIGPTTSNMTNGSLSPIVPDNCGTLNITGEPTDQSSRKRK